jgi:tetratricopeptide (TPR) repeat protein
MLTAPRRLILAVLLLSLGAGCTREKQAARVVPPPTDAEATAFANAYREALAKPNVQRAAMMVDWDALLEKATANTDVAASFKNGFITGAKERGGRVAFAEQLSQVIQKGGQLTLLRIRTDANGGKRAVLRLILPDGAINYHEMVLGRDEQGLVRARDIYVYTSSEYLSDTMRRMFLFAAAQNPGFLQQLAGEKNPFLEHIEDYKKMMEKVRAGDGKGAAELYTRLPQNVRREKSVMLANVMASSQIDDTTYGRALDEFRAAFPRDAGVDLMSIDAYILKERYDDALGAVDRLDASVGGDPYLDVLRANIHIKAGSLDRAHEAASRAAQQEPTLVPAYWSLISIALARKDDAETVRLLTHLRDRMGVQLADLSTIPEYAGFVESMEYRKWLAASE